MELVKTKWGYYVSWDYMYHDYTALNAPDMRKSSKWENHPSHTGKSTGDPPSYRYDKETEKWCLSFTGIEVDGYKIEDFAFYFDSEEDLLRFLKR